MKRKKLSPKELYKRVATSEGHAQIFYELAWKPSYHEELAKKFNLGLGIISDRVSNLLKIGLIKKVEKKEGRKQFYEVDWNTFFEVWKIETEKYVIVKHSKFIFKHLKLIKKNLSSIGSNPKFREFFKTQLKLASPMTVRSSLEQFIVNTNNELIYYYLNKKLKSTLAPIAEELGQATLEIPRVHDEFEEDPFGMAVRAFDKQGKLSDEELYDLVHEWTKKWVNMDIKKVEVKLGQSTIFAQISKKK